MTDHERARQYGEDDYDRCTVCGQTVYYNGSSPETTILMHSDYPADGHEPQLRE